MTDMPKMPDMPETNRRVRVLLVEDLAEVRELFRVFLQRLSVAIELTVAGSTWEARQGILRHRPEVVLLDEVLPGESSYDLLPELARQGIPVVLLSGMAIPLPTLPAGVLGRMKKPDWDRLEQDVPRFNQLFEPWTQIAKQTD